MLSHQRIAVVIPAHQEERLIAPTIAGVPAFVDHVVVVDDASSDGTSDAVRALDDPRVELIRHRKNQGVGAAIRTGYRSAMRTSDVVAVMAGDGQMDPRDLPAILGPILEGDADYVKGNRLRHPRAADMPILRRAGTSALAWVTARAVGLPGLGDTQSGYTAISASLLRAMPLESLWPRYGYPNDLIALVASAGGRIVEVPVRPVYAGESSGLRAWHMLVILGVIARSRWLPSRIMAPQGARR